MVILIIAVKLYVKNKGILEFDSLTTNSFSKPDHLWLTRSGKI